MQDQLPSDRDFEWLDHVQPVGLVLARSLLKSLGLSPERQTKSDEDIVAGLLDDNPARPALKDPWAFFRGVLGWQAGSMAGAPGSEPLPEILAVRLPEYETTLAPSWAVRGVKGEAPWQLLVRIEDAGINADKRAALAGWEASPHQRFERLLRETQAQAGVLVTDNELRLIYAPRAETSGWIPFPLRPLGTVTGRPMLAGLKLVLGAFRLFNDSPERRLPALLRDSREAQANVSTHLSAQVLGALHDLLRGMHEAEPKLIGDLATNGPQHLYEGLLSVLMRLVFILYAEDRDLIPSRTDAHARALYDQGYSVRGLFAKLLEDEAHYPDTMSERVGGWGRLLALFRLVHGGHSSGWIKGRGGKLFDPNAFPFLEGRVDAADNPRVLSVSDGAILHVLRGLMVVDGERLSYRTLDVEQIGSVYETVMGFTVESAAGQSLAIRAGRNNKVPVFVDLQTLLQLKPAERAKRIKEGTGRKLTGRSETDVKQAKSVAELAAAIDSIIDERGSPGRRVVAANAPILQPTDERRRTGSHYTPRSLTEPIVRHALEPAFERIGPDAKPEDVLALKVCDPAMGSGAFLVEACRMLAARLVQAWTRWPETRPVIPLDEDDELHARRLIAQRCLYGVDKNPMATDLAKLSLWLATLARDHEFEFVDHALKTGDSLVGLSLTGIATADWDENKPGLPLFQRLVKDRMREALAARSEIREAPDDVQRFIQEVRHQNLEKRLDPIRTMGDATIAAFFSETKPRAREQARQKVESLFTASLHPNWDEIAKIAALLRHGDHSIRPFHWQLEFPEVFDGKNPGFDAIVGNPPFLGGTRVTEQIGDAYNGWLAHIHSGALRRSDLVAHCFRRAFNLVRSEGAIGLIATNTIGQGDTRETGLTFILQNGGSVVRAVRRLKWPGEAAVEVSVLHIRKGIVVNPILDRRPVKRISAYLSEGTLDEAPHRLVANARKAFMGAKITGMGFTFDDAATDKATVSSLADMEHLIRKDRRNGDRILPYIGGDEVNTDPQQRHRRYVIDFGHFSETEARSGWPDLMALVEERVRPAREKLRSKGGWSAKLAATWWQHAQPADALGQCVKKQTRVIARSLTSAHFPTFTFLPTGMVYDQTLIVWASEKPALLAVLASRAHETWGRFFGATLEDRGRYAPSDCFSNFALPPGFDAEAPLEAFGQAYHDHRGQVMIARNEGLTKTYNRFHDPNEKSPDIIKLRELHDAMDCAVLTAYGWTDLAKRISSDPDAMPRHLTEVTEDDHKYQGRYFWPAAIRDELLARLLALNAERAEEERLAGLTPIASVDEGDDALDDQDDS